MYFFITKSKTCGKFQHLGKKIVKMTTAKESSTKNNILKVLRLLYLRALITSQSSTSTLSIRAKCLWKRNENIIKNAEKDSMWERPIKNFWPKISFYHSEFLHKKGRALQSFVICGVALRVKQKFFLIFSFSFILIPYLLVGASNIIGRVIGT